MENIFIHWLKTLCRWLIIVVIVAPLLMIVLLLTPAGLKIGLVVTSKMIPGKLHYREAKGSLLGNLTIEQLDYRYQGRRFTAKHLYLVWHPERLLYQKLSIEKIVLTDLLVTIPAENKAPENITVNTVKHALENIRPFFTDLRLPLNLEIQQGRMNRIKFGQKPGEFPILIDNIHLKALAQINKVNVKLSAQLVQPYPLQTQLSVEGVPQDYHFQLTAYNPETHWIVNGKVTPLQIQLDTQDALIFGGRLAIHLNWHWVQPINWELKFSARHIDLSKLYPDWPHPIEAKIDTNGYLGADSPHFIWDAVISTAHTKIETQGKYDQQWHAIWNISIKQLAELLPFSSGSIISNGELNGSIKNPETKGSMQANLLRWRNYRLDKVTGSWDIDATLKRNSNFQINGSELLLDSVRVNQLQLSGNGKWDKHQLQATIHAYNTDLNLQLDGGIGKQSWQGSLSKLNIFTPIIGKLDLVKPTALVISPQKIDITALCLANGVKSQICLRGQWQGADNAWWATMNGRLSFQQLATLIPEELVINTPLDVNANVQGVGSQIIQGQLTGNSGSGFIRYADEGRKLQLDVKNANINAKIDKNGGMANLQINFKNLNTINATVTLPKVSTQNLLASNQELQGKIRVRLEDLSSAEAFMPDVMTPGGKFNADFTLGGTLGEPLINGNASLDQGQIKIPGLNIQLMKINLALVSKGKQIFYTLNATSGNQPLKVVGQTDWQESGFPTQLTLTGNHVLLADTPLYLFYASPNIRLTLKGHDINIGGELNIPQAIIRQLEFEQGATLPSDEIVFVGEHPIVKKAPWNITTELVVNLGDDVKIDTSGVKGKLTGSITLISQPGQTLLGVGKIDIHDGTYEVYGRKLTISPNSGIAYRHSPLSNPSLNIQATTRVAVTDALSQQQLGTNEITVGMNIGGTSTSPQVTLFASAGNLSQADMLSYLLLGTSSAGISPTNMSLLLQTLNTLPLTKRGTSGVEGLTNQIKQSLGFTEFGVTSESTYGPSGEPIPTSVPTSYFVVGKRITSRIYLRYKYDPFTATNLFQLNYLFSKNWSLQFETDGSTQSGADILYTIETGLPKSLNKTQEQGK